MSGHTSQVSQRNLDKHETLDHGHAASGETSDPNTVFISDPKEVVSHISASVITFWTYA